MAFEPANRSHPAEPALLFSGGGWPSWPCCPGEPEGGRSGEAAPGEGGKPEALAAVDRHHTYLWVTVEVLAELGAEDIEEDALSGVVEQDRADRCEVGRAVLADGGDGVVEGRSESSPEHLPGHGPVNLPIRFRHDDSPFRSPQTNGLRMCSTVSATRTSVDSGGRFPARSAGRTAA